jgi:hypothetical protein
MGNVKQHIAGPALHSFLDLSTAAEKGVAFVGSFDDPAYLNDPADAFLIPLGKG